MHRLRSLVRIAPILILAVAATASLAQMAGNGGAPAPAPAPQVSLANVPRLKDVYAGDFLIGTAVDFRSSTEFNERELEIIKSQFNVITPENSMKPQVHSAKDTWNWTVPDNLVKFCQENNIKIHGHTLAWHAQTPNWFFTGDDGQPVTRDVAIARLKEHIQTEVGHFKGKMFSWDVVNEAINDGGPADTENLRNSPWVRAVGPEYITMAFKFAREADPDVKLYYNDYNIEKGNKHKSSVLLLKRLIKDGAPITGVGVQGHWSLNNTPFADIDQAIQDYADLGLKVSISELDITFQGQGGGQLNPAGGAPGAPGAPGGGRGGAGGPDEPTMPVIAAAPGAGGPPATGPAAERPGRRGRGGGGGGGGFGRGNAAPATPEQLKAQAEAYAKLFQIFEKHKNVMERVTFWGLNDRRSWRTGQNPLLFDNNNNPKPAIEAIANVKKAQ